jgi:tetratricopeptide (TPR) repeat protein
MAGLLDSMFQLSAGIAERGLLMMDSALRTMQQTAERMAGVKPQGLPSTPPIDGPASLNDATSDLANRLFRLWWSIRHSPQDTSAAWKDIVHAVRESFGGIDLDDPRQWMLLPIDLPLSLGTLMTQQSLRGLYAGQIVGPRHMLDFAQYMAENLTDVHVFVSLQYKDLLKRYDEVIAKNPGDAEARLGRARTYLKMGLYPEAVQDFRTAAESPGHRATALRDSAVASYRAGRFRESIVDGVGALRADPSNKRAHYWLWLAAQKSGGYTTDVPESMRVDVKAGRSHPTVMFEDVAAKIGLDKTAGSRGTAVFDLDGDGYLDIVVASAHGGCSVYRNNGNGTFSDISVGSGLDECVNTFTITVGDYNNDGLDDLYITRLGFYPGDSVLYRNNGDGTFTDVTRETGTGCWGASFAAHWVDYNCDGNLDLFVCTNIGGVFDRTGPNRLFRNNGDGTFTDVSLEAGIDTNAPTIGACWGDYNNDGYPDVFVSSGLGRSKLFRNNGDGTFTDVSREAGFDNIDIGTVAFWCDYDNDGKLDLVQCTWSPEDDVLDTLFQGKGPAHGKPMRIYQNNGDGTFTLKNRELGISGCFGTMSANFGDFDNDGYVDFLLGNGDPHMNRTEPPIILQYDQVTGQYRNATFTSGLPFTGKGHGANLADLAGDGRVCLIMASGGAYPGDLMTMSVFRPVSLPGNYLNVRLVGTTSNRNALGARVRLDAGGRSQYRHVSGGAGFGCLPYEQHFGLGRIETVDSLEIVWPSGVKQRIHNLPSNTTIRITEGRAEWEEVYKAKQMAAELSA